MARKRKKRVTLTARQKKLVRALAPKAIEEMLAAPHIMDAHTLKGFTTFDGRVLDKAIILSNIFTCNAPPDDNNALDRWCKKLDLAQDIITDIFFDSHPRATNSSIRL